MQFTKLLTESDLRHYLRSLKSFDGGRFDINALNRGPRKIDYLVKAIVQKREIVFGQNQRGEGVCCSTKSEVLMRVRGYQAVETMREVGEEIIHTDTSKVVRTTSETGMESDGSPEGTAVRCMREEAKIEIKESDLICISRPPIRDFGDPRDCHKSSVYKGLWRQEMKTCFLLNWQQRPKDWRTRLYIEDDDVTVYGNWWKEEEIIHGPWDNATRHWQEVFQVADAAEDDTTWQEANAMFRSLFEARLNA